MEEIGCNVPRGLIQVGVRSINRVGSYLTVLGVNKEVGKGMYNVQLDSGLSKLMAGKEIRNGCWKDNMHPVIYGVGFLGDGKYVAKVGCFS